LLSEPVLWLYCLDENELRKGALRVTCCLHGGRVEGEADVIFAGLCCVERAGGYCETLPVLGKFD
jgi:hypothetical protein